MFFFQHSSTLERKKKCEKCNAEKIRLILMPLGIDIFVILEWIRYKFSIMNYYIPGGKNKNIKEQLCYFSGF